MSADTSLVAPGAEKKRGYLALLVAGFFTLLSGMWVTLKNLFRKPVTLRYPRERPELSTAFRSAIDLVDFEELGSHDCVACMQCVNICPSFCIQVEGQKYDGVKRKRATKFLVDYALCSVCGLCIDVCPTETLKYSKIYDEVSFERDAFVFDLLEPFVEREEAFLEGQRIADAKEAEEKKKKAEAAKKAKAAVAAKKKADGGEEAEKAEKPKAEKPKAAKPKAEAPKAEAPRADEPKAEAEAEAPKAEADAPKAEADAPKADEPKAGKVDKAAVEAKPAEPKPKAAFAKPDSDAKAASLARIEAAKKRALEKKKQAEQQAEGEGE